MANLDSRFICSSDIDSYFVDKSSGLPMAGGIVTFYSDVNRTVLKPVYQLTGNPGNYTYAPLNNPVTLSSSGTYQDALGNNIAVYYYPFTGTPEDNTGVQELYYAVVVNSGLVPQLVRQGWPQAAGGGEPPVTTGEIENFIPNGQFLAHNQWVSLTEPPILPAGGYTLTTGAGSVPVYAQAIAQGGWNFIYSQSSTAIFNHSFQQIPSSAGWGMNSFPKYIFNYVCTSIGNAPTYRDLRIQWPDVNKFSSGNPAGSTPYSLYFDARSNDGNTYVFNVYQVYYYGTGGAPGNYIENQIGSITIGPGMSFKSQNLSNFFFPPNEGAIGTNGDDYVGITIRGPNSSWNIAVSDFALVQGNVILSAFPEQTNDEMLSRGVAGWMPTPNPNGQDLYLPLILTAQGMIFDHSQVGTIVPALRAIFPHELPADGNGYVTSAYASNGIPYSRLGNTWYNSTTGCNLFGNGINYANAYVDSGTTADVVLYSNKLGLSPVNGTTADGAVMTNFTFTTLFAAGSASIGYNSFTNSTGLVTAISTFVTPANADSGTGTSTMAVTDLVPYSLTGTKYAFTVQAIAAASLAAGASTPGLYFLFSNASTSYYMWFQVSTETDPAPGGTGIKCKLESGMLAADVAIAIANCMNQVQGSLIACGAGSTVAAGSYFTFIANSVTYTPWYQVNSLPATAPVGLTNPIQVTIASTATAAQVATATQQAINKNFVGTPNLTGVFLRGSDPTGIWDLDHATRWAQQGAIVGGNIGSFEYGQLLQHTHSLSTGTVDYNDGMHGTLPIYGASGGAAAGYRIAPSYAENNGTIYTIAGSAAATGGTENRPVNASVNYFIRF